MKYSAIIFDLDGVICHTDQYHYEAWKAIANKLDIPFDQEINNRLRGVSRMESFNIILEKYDGDMTEEEKVNYADEKNSIYKKLLENMSLADLSEEVKNTLVHLRRRGIKLSIGSSSKNAKFILNQIGLGDFFDAISDGNNIRYSKPDPEVFLKAAEYLNLPAEKSLVVEDAVAGVEAAMAAGMDSCAIGDAVNSGKATYNLASFNDLLEIVV
jgi:beta-phosphoglucomutase